MKDSRWLLLLGGSMFAVSVVFFALQILIFKRTEDTLFYIVQDLAFLPVNALLVVIILEKLLKRFEKLSMLKKLNMVIGIFFSEVGNHLLDLFAGFDKNHQDVMKYLLITDKWSDADFTEARKHLRDFHFTLDARHGNLQELHEFFNQKRTSVLALMENPNLLEHESFTDMLLAVSHLLQELAARKDLTRLSAIDADHISLDMKRAYSSLAGEWLGYMNHLKNEYPYLYSLAVRTNPFDPEAQPEVK